MSYHSWIEYGYGVITSKIILKNVEGLKKLLRLAPNYEAEIKEFFKANDITQPTIEDYLEYEMEENYLATILQKVIFETESIDFFACQDHDGYNYLLYLPSYPWYMQQNEYSITKEYIENILNKYIGILSDNFPKPDYLECHNGG